MSVMSDLADDRGKDRSTSHATWLASFRYSFGVNLETRASRLLRLKQARCDRRTYIHILGDGKPCW
jgi:hypothetical protein